MTRARLWHTVTNNMHMLFHIQLGAKWPAGCFKFKKKVSSHMEQKNGRHWICWLTHHVATPHSLAPSPWQWLDQGHEPRSVVEGTLK